jgi:ParB-like chromosome segregation protein Spo0J
MSFQNEVDSQRVSNIVTAFRRELWMPLTVNRDFFLLDGQHRMATALLLGLRYVDVVVQDTELLEKD